MFIHSIMINNLYLEREQDEEKRICFIICIKNQDKYKQALEYIKNLNIPEEYEVECMSITDAPSIAAGYNLGIKCCKARYRIYVHEDVYIVNKDFLYDLISLFKADSKLGLVGIIGAKKLPLDGIWWNGNNLYGKVNHNINGFMEEMSVNEPKDVYESVQAIDGLIMATQYDIPWREDIFTGWHFYDISQCLEFIKKGFNIGIPKQYTSWCIHDCGIIKLDNRYEYYRNVLIKEYGKSFINPLVSVLIPTCNRRYFLQQSLESAINQTYKNIEIIICDDSRDNDIQSFIKPYMEKYSNIRYYFNAGPLGKRGAENFNKCFKLSKGEYINFLNDDDYFYPEKIEKMIKYFTKFQNITLVTSYRKIIDQYGRVQPDIPATKRMFNSDTILDGKIMGGMLVSTITNFIGEPTSVLFKKEAISDLWSFGGNEYIINGDICLWLKLLSKGRGVYISEPLSCFRIHNKQKCSDIDVVIEGIMEWPGIIEESYKMGFLKNEIEYKEALKKILALEGYACGMTVNNENNINSLRNFFNSIRQKLSK